LRPGAAGAVGVRTAGHPTGDRRPGRRGHRRPGRRSAGPDPGRTGPGTGPADRGRGLAAALRPDRRDPGRGPAARGARRAAGQPADGGRTGGRRGRLAGPSGAVRSRPAAARTAGRIGPRRDRLNPLGTAVGNGRQHGPYHLPSWSAFLGSLGGDNRGENGPRGSLQRKKATVATRPDQSSTGSPAAGASRSQSATHEQPDAALDLADDVGANEWLLEEMYERYR